MDVTRDDVLFIEAFLVNESHREVEFLRQYSRSPGSSLVWRTDHSLLPVRDIFFDPPRTHNCITIYVATSEFLRLLFALQNLTIWQNDLFLGNVSLNMYGQCV